MFQAANFEDNEPLNAGWAEGDWDGDTKFTTTDFVFAFQAGDYELGPREGGVMVVPEPTSLGWIATGMFAFAYHRIRKSRFRLVT